MTPEKACAIVDGWLTPDYPEDKDRQVARVLRQALAEAQAEIIGMRAPPAADAAEMAEQLVRGIARFELIHGEEVGSSVTVTVGPRVTAYVARAIEQARTAERARVIEEAAHALGDFEQARDMDDRTPAEIVRALGRQAMTDLPPMVPSAEERAGELQQAVGSGQWGRAAIAERLEAAYREGALAARDAGGRGMAVIRAAAALLPGHDEAIKKSERARIVAALREPSDELRLAVRSAYSDRGTYSALSALSDWLETSA